MNFQVDAVYGGSEAISYKSKKTGNMVEGNRATMIVEGIGILEFAFGNCKVEAKELAQYQPGEQVRLTLALTKGFRSEPSVTLVAVESV